MPEVDRRLFLSTIAVATLQLSARTSAQQPVKLYRVGFLINGTVGSDYDDVQNDLRDLGYIPGKNIIFERRFARDRPERLPALAAELVALKPDVIFVTGTAGTAAAQQSTGTIPIVMSATDPVGNGFVESLVRPGRNITGVTTLAIDLGAKQVEILHVAAPSSKRIAVLMTESPSHPALFKQLLEAASHLQLSVVPIRTSSTDFEAAFSAMRAAGADALIVADDPVLNNYSEPIAKLASDAKLPSISSYRDFMEDGGLLSYGQVARSRLKIVAGYIDKILRGAQPKELPVQQPTNFELVINLRTAKALGLTIPQALQVRADTLLG